MTTSDIIGFIVVVAIGLFLLPGCATPQPRSPHKDIIEDLQYTAFLNENNALNRRELTEKLVILSLKLKDQKCGKN